MKIKTSDAIGPKLDWAVAKAGGGLDAEVYIGKQKAKAIVIDEHGYPFSMTYGDRYAPSADWAQGGPIIERERIDVVWQIGDECWSASGNYQTDGYTEAFGPTPPIAAMRCFVASKLGDEVEVPEELV